MVLRIRKLNIFRVFFYILIFDLVLGGSGHIISFGPISFRYILFLVVGLIELYLSTGLFVSVNGAYALTFLFLEYLTLSTLVSLNINPVRNVIDEFLGYLPLLLCPFFGYCFKYNVISIKQVKKAFLSACFWLGILSILLWLYAFVRGTGVYQVVEVGFLRRYDIGRLAFSGRLVRLFMKGTVFCTIGFVMCFYDWLNGKKGEKPFITMAVCFASVILSFTLGLYIAAAAGVLLSILKLRKNKRFARVLVLLLISIVVILIVAFRFGVIDLMQERFSGEYTLSFKFIQTRELVRDFIHSPIFGNGLGNVITVNYGYIVSTGYRFENMWGEILDHYGLAGFTIFSLAILITINDLWKKSRRTNCAEYAMFAIGIIIIAVESLSNPFLNNAIGLTYLAMCIGMTLDDGVRLLTDGKITAK